MSKRRERRTRMAVPVRVRDAGRGKDAPATAAVTLDVSAGGARLQIFADVRAGDIVWVERGPHKAPFRVAWVGGQGTDRQGQIGVECVTRDFTWDEMIVSRPDDPYIDPKKLAEQEAQEAAAVASLSGSGAGAQSAASSHKPGARTGKSSSVRIAAQGEVEVRTELGRRITIRSRIREVSSRGCYVLTTAPLPVRTKVLVFLQLTLELRLDSRGVVRASDVSQGMWIDFHEMDNASRVALQRYLEGRAPARK
jgi:PilZ domain-containing protein